MNLANFSAMDEKDPLSGLRGFFDLTENTVYLVGHSLGALPRGVAERVESVIAREWGDDLVRSWNTHDWIGLPTRVGDRLGKLIGADRGQVVCADSTSLNIFKLLSTALSLRPGRNVILSQDDNFPTDLYVAEGLASLLGPNRCVIEKVPSENLIHSIDENVAVVMLTHVNFRDGSLHDISTITGHAHEHGALVLWDLAHSAGVMPLELDSWNVDMAVGCGYKYLNGGPGAPAFLYLARRHQERASQPLCGWMGHANPFDFSSDYVPAENIDRFQVGTPGILGMAALDAALDVFDNMTMEDVRNKSLALTENFIKTLSNLHLPGVRIMTPAKPELRGSQVSIAHEHGFAISQALISLGILVDFREPDVVRFGFSPLYNRFSDIGLAVSALARIVNERLYLDPAFSLKPKVT